MAPEKYLLPLHDPYSVRLLNIHNSLTNKMDTSVLKQVYINNDLNHLAANHYIRTPPTSFRETCSRSSCMHFVRASSSFLLRLLLLLFLLTLQPWVVLGPFNNSIPLMSILELRPPTNNFHPLQVFFYLVHPP